MRFATVDPFGPLTCIKTIRQRPRPLCGLWIPSLRRAAMPRSWAKSLIGTTLPSFSMSGRDRPLTRVALCKRFPALRATILDLTGTLKFTHRYVREAGMEDRIRLLRGDYRKDTIPGTYDIVFLSNINDERRGERRRKSDLLRVP